MFETNANANRHFRSADAAAVARVAVEWKAQGHEPKAYAILDGDGDAAVKVVDVPVTKVRETAKSLKAAK